MINNITDAISSQLNIDNFLKNQNMKDLVGDYGEVLISKALGGQLQKAVNQGFDILHDTFGRIEVKTRKYRDSKSKETRAVGFKGKENGFDWLAHIVLDEHYLVENACLAKYDEVWPEILSSSQKISYANSSTLKASIDITQLLQETQKILNQ